VRRARLLLRFAAALVPANAVHAASVLAALRSLVDAALGMAQASECAAAPGQGCCLCSVALPCSPPCLRPLPGILVSPAGRPGCVSNRHRWSPPSTAQAPTGTTAAAGSPTPTTWCMRR
jgi:hypothetical protein